MPDALDDLLDAVPAPPSPVRPRAPRPRAAAVPSPSLAVDPHLDSFVSDVMNEATARTGYTYKLGEGVRTPAQQAGKVAQGVSWTLHSKHLDGRGRDVLAFDE